MPPRAHATGDDAHRLNVPRSKGRLGFGPHVFGDLPMDPDYRVVRERLNEHRNPARPEHAVNLTNRRKQLDVMEAAIAEHAGEGGVE